MGRMIRLLDKSFKVFMWYAAIVLACSIPAYYAIVDYIWQTELKEHNTIVSEEIKNNLQSQNFSDSVLNKSVALWNRLQPSNHLREVTELKLDSTYNIYRKNNFSKKEERFQGLTTYFQWKGKKFALSVETNMEESHETILGLALVSLIFFVLLLIGLIILNRRLSDKIWQPFNSSIKTIQEFDLNRHDLPVFEETDIVEFETLNNRLEHLIKANINSFEQQKQFVENASHELQTPLAVIQSKLDLFLQEAALSKRQSEIIDQAQNALGKANRINRNMLLLAKIENNYFEGKEWIDLKELLQENLEMMSSFIEAKRLSFALRYSGVTKIKTNSTLLEILLSNLLTNAIRYSEENSKIDIQISGHYIIISNPGTHALQKEHLFQRFGRVNNETPATGLGLAIVQQVCLQFKWDIIYAFEAGQHKFSVTLL